MVPDRWQVWIGDLRASKRITAEARPLASGHLEGSIQATVRRFRRAFKLRPTVLRGDEIQAVLTPDAPALKILTYLRAQLATKGDVIQEIYAGMGFGTIPVMHARNPFESDGPAFHLARRALDSLKDRKNARARTVWVTEAPEFDEAAAAMLPLLDTFFSRWSREQWEAIVHRMHGATMHTIGEALGVATQAAHKRLHAARWREVAKAMAYLDSLQPGAPARSVSAASGGVIARGSARERTTTRPRATGPSTSGG